MNYNDIYEIYMVFKKNLIQIGLLILVILIIFSIECLTYRNNLIYALAAPIPGVPTTNLSNNSINNIKKPKKQKKS
jgi:hypothetical protein